MFFDEHAGFPLFEIICIQKPPCKRNSNNIRDKIPYNFSCLLFLLSFPKNWVNRALGNETFDMFGNTVDKNSKFKRTHKQKNHKLIKKQFKIETEAAFHLTLCLRLLSNNSFLNYCYFLMLKSLCQGCKREWRSEGNITDHLPSLCTFNQSISVFAIAIQILTLIAGLRQSHK